MNGKSSPLSHDSKNASKSSVSRSGSCNSLSSNKIPMDQPVTITLECDTRESLEVSRRSQTPMSYSEALQKDLTPMDQPVTTTLVCDTCESLEVSRRSQTPMSYSEALQKDLTQCSSQKRQSQSFCSDKQMSTASTPLQQTNPSNAFPTSYGTALDYSGHSPSRSVLVAETVESMRNASLRARRIVSMNDRELGSSKSPVQIEEAPPVISAETGTAYQSVTQQEVVLHEASQDQSNDAIDLPAIPQYRVLLPPNFNWGGVPGADIKDQIDQAYREVVHWKRNLFQVPYGSSGGHFVSKLTRLFYAFANESDLESVAITAAMTWSFHRSRQSF